MNRREIARYECEDDDLNEYTVIVFQNYRRWVSVDGRSKDVPTTKEMFLSDGRPVNFIDDNTFQIVHTDQIIRKIS